MDSLIWPHKAAQFGANRFHQRAEPPLACGWGMEGCSSYLEDEGTLTRPRGSWLPIFLRGRAFAPTPRSAISALSQSSRLPVTFVHFTNDPESHYSPSKEKKISFPTNESKEGGEREGGSGRGNLKSSISPEKRWASELLKLIKCLCTGALVSFQEHTHHLSGWI